MATPRDNVEGALEDLLAKYKEEPGLLGLGEGVEALDWSTTRSESGWAEGSMVIRGSDRAYRVTVVITPLSGGLL